jgi:hypothetical protein
VHLTFGTSLEGDDPDFNILFVSSVKKHRCFFDFNCAKYSNKNNQEKAWKTITMFHF